MNQKQYTTRERKYQHLNLCERKEIEKGIRSGYSITEIAQALGRHKSTISREINRGSITQRKTKKYIPSVKRQYEWADYTEYKAYFADTGQESSYIRRSQCGCKYKLFKDQNLIKYIEEKILKEKYSPDAVIGSLPEGFNIRICTKTLYNYIDRGLLGVKNIDLIVKVKLKPKKKRIKAYKRQLGKSIDYRPQEVALRQEFGHWEGDTVVGKNHKGAILTLIERKTNKGFMLKLKDKSAAAVQNAFNELKSFNALFKTITFDNGSEFAKCTQLENDNLKIYYAHPYSAYERGINENYNRIIRRFIPKGTSFETLTQETLNRINNWIDSYPRKRHNYKSANQMFEMELHKIFPYPMG